MINNVPRAIAAVVGDVIGSYVYSHRRIETLCYECGFSGEVPSGNCCDKITSWILREAETRGADVYKSVGLLIEGFMDTEFNAFGGEERIKDQQRIRDILSKHGLTYSAGGLIYGAAASAPTKALDELLKTRSIPEINIEFQRALEGVENDPPSAITAACAILESFCRVYLQEEGLSVPADRSAKPLWNAVAHHIGFAPAAQMDQDVRKVLSGFLGVVDGIACLRTHDGSAHGKERRTYSVRPRHARLAVHAAHTLVLFGLETWAEKRGR